MLTPNMFLLPLPPLCLDLHHHRPGIHAHHPRPTLKQSLVDIIRFSGPLSVVVFRNAGPGFESVVAGTEQGGTVQA